MPWEPHIGIDLSSIPASVVIVSDSLFSGETELSEDISGPNAVNLLSELEFSTINLDYYPDDFAAIKGKIEGDITQSVGLIFLIGGTGISYRDVTVEAVKSVIKKELPGFGEEFRRRSYEEVQELGLMSRSTAGVSGQSMIVALPGSPNAVRVGVELVKGMIGHVLKLIRS